MVHTHTHTNHRFGNILRQKCRAKANGKEIRYKKLWIGIKRMCNRRYKIIPVTIRVTIIVTRGSRKNLEVVPGKYSIDSL